MNSCQYVMLYGEGLDAALCAQPCDGDYCTTHRKLMDVIDDLDASLQQIVRENRKLKE